MDEYIERESLRLKVQRYLMPNVDADGTVLVNDAERYFLKLLEDAPATDVVEIPQSGIGDLSDGYHTFNELYRHRAVLFSVLCNLMPDKAWKSKLHDTGDMYDGMFIVGIETPSGQATYHYDVDPYWEMFKVKELEKAPKWDGHTPQDAIERLSTMTADVVEVVRCKDCEYNEMCFPCKGFGLEAPPVYVCRLGHRNREVLPNDYCSCGAKMDGKDGV